jgi:F0F1-type ATP synthase membrane subunit a
MSIVFAVIGLELSIAFLQAYVFIVLATLYLKDVVHPH